MIAGTRAVFASDKNLILKSMKAIQWRLRGSNGEFVGLSGMRCSFVAEKDAIIFDARDNETIKTQTYSRALGALTIEILQQITHS